jgi:hypothetical protein
MLSILRLFTPTDVEARFPERLTAGKEKKSGFTKQRNQLATAALIGAR